MKCRFCGTPLQHVFASLGPSPLSNAYLTDEQVRCAEPMYPLDAYVCDACFLVQVDEHQSPENIFEDYAYFSSYSDTWLKHAEEYADKVARLLHLGKNAFVVEIASNDGYLLQYFVKKGISVLGIEPAKNVASLAIKKGIPTETVFFGEATAKTIAGGKKPDLVIGNNVLAHVPQLNDFVAGLKILLKQDGIITMEFPHLMKLVENNQFDTIYHEHFSYFSFLTAEKVFAAQGLVIYDVEELPTHGGSLRIYARHDGNTSRTISGRVNEMKQREVSAGFENLDLYLSFRQKVTESRDQIMAFLTNAKREGKSVVGYGAPAKGNTLLNYCGIGTDLMSYTVDRSPYKQGRYLPGSHIPIASPDKIRETKPDYVLILPWNLQDEIMQQMAHIKDWGGRFVVPIPRLKVL